jgi:hypothetical protein
VETPKNLLVSGWWRAMRIFLRTLATPLASLLLLPVTAVTAQATVVDSGTFFNQQTEVNQVFGSECVPGAVPGVETITFTTSGRFLQTGSGFHVQGTSTVSGRTVYSNGDYQLADGHAAFSFNTSATSGQTVNTIAGPELHTVYNAQGQVIAKIMFAGTSHTTYRDANGNGQPDPGEITTTFEHVHFTCLGR